MGGSVVRLAYVAGLSIFVQPFACSASDVTIYTYDARGHVVQINRTSSKPTLNAGYTFDGADNRSSQSLTGSTTTPDVSDWSFELPYVGAGFLYNPSPTGATFNGNSGIAGNGSAWAFTSAPDGTQVAFLQAVPATAPSISLNTTNLESGRRYVILFKAALRLTYPVNPVTVKYSTTSLGTFSPTSTSFQSFASSSFVAAATADSISFNGVASSGDITTGLDAVAVVAVPDVSDYSFESPYQAGTFTYGPTIQGVTFEPGAGIQANGSAWAFSSAPDGTQTAFLQSPSASVGTGLSVAVDRLVPGRSYTITFRAAQRPGSALMPVTVAYNGVTLGTYSPASTAFQTFTTPAFVASEMANSLRFSIGAASGGPATGLDFIQVSPVS